MISTQSFYLLRLELDSQEGYGSWSDLISASSDRFGVFRFFNSRSFLCPAVPIGSVYSGIVTVGGSSWPAVPIGSVYSGISTVGASCSPAVPIGISIFRLFNCRCLFLSCSTDEPSVLRFFNSRSWFLSLACSWLTLVNLFSLPF